MPQRTIILVRHGQTDQSAPPADKLGNGLTAQGIQQAELTGRRLAGLPVAAIRHSTARRAQQTAEVIAAQFPGVPVQGDPVLLECIPAYPPAFVEWYSGVAGALPAGDTVPPAMRFWLDLWPSGTPWPVMAAEVAQAAAAYERYFAPPPDGAGDAHEIIVCHGNIIRYFMLRVLQAPPDLWIHADIYNCGICEIVVRGERGTQLLSFNDSGHLPAELRMFF
ncbi:MAG TPA: histidine phosphatase family protein [Chloroflexia bacterium]|jgi:serine/threonine-protein phosphatase PGAM5|nr:histidine phosphatase family protein [Chloroflexia bacterium]